jgi:hypothetical protein
MCHVSPFPLGSTISPSPVQRRSVSEVYGLVNESQDGESVRGKKLRHALDHAVQACDRHDDWCPVDPKPIATFFNTQAGHGGRANGTRLRRLKAFLVWNPTSMASASTEGRLTTFRPQGHTENRRAGGGSRGGRPRRG